jgi:hypothetical protein
MAPPIAEAVHRLPPSRVSLALGRGAASRTASRSRIDRLRRDCRRRVHRSLRPRDKGATGAAEVFDEGYLLRLSAVLMQTAAMLVGIGLLARVVRRMFLSGRLAIDRSKRTNIRVPRRS